MRIEKRKVTEIGVTYLSQPRNEIIGKNMVNLFGVAQRFL